ncbi:MAG TPA: DUF3823 domain-containing protein [Bacteroidales bacterium]|nr:DUF3823 domain-containing protein [Bacteroidales bacterium]HPJ60773.1 DUF3823 domain-containing protein [Bacteroidales bacterium]HPR10743.1 DUF3823 domain-containing protein [Bacteroidales bacterium]HRW85954.1 DUF3823 domain-containing protein [Bacteroidales bacterium]
MKTKYILNSVIAVLLLIMAISCDKPITDFGFDGGLSGTVKDAAGNIVPGDITNSNFVVRVLAETDVSTIDLRVKGDGTFSHTKLWPVPSKVYISGPIVPAATDTVVLDLSGGQIVHDFVVTPVFTIDKPVIVSTPSDTTVNVSFNITQNSTNTPSSREIYCSTVQYPNTSTGSGASYSTIKKSLSSNSGTYQITGLKWDTRYFIRIGVRSSSTQYNFSEQVTLTTPVRTK